MKKAVLLSLLLIFGLTLFSGCVSMQRWPDEERNAENKMIIIQQKIGEGLKTGALTPDQSESFLERLKVIRMDYMALRERMVYREEWDKLSARLDTLSSEIDAAMGRPARMERPGIEDRIAALQRRIDDGKISGRFPVTEGREFQYRLDSIRSDYLRMTDRGRYATNEERADISRRLDMLEIDLNRFR
jgi:hypothetical protein